MPIQATIIEILHAVFKPQTLQVTNQSAQHRLGGVDSHFKIVIVCSQWAALSRLARHRSIYQALAAQLKPQGPIHALALHAYTPQEWPPNHPPDSPPCANKKG